MSKIPKFGCRNNCGTSQTTDELPELPRIQTTIRKNLRRSKSYSSLKTSHTTSSVPLSSLKKNFTNSSNKVASNISRTVLPLTNKTKVASSSVKLNSARPVPTVQSNKRKNENAECESKPKMVKKVPDWDYKTRFGILNEKYTNLLQDYKETQILAAESKEISQRNQNLIVEVNDLKNQKENFLAQIKGLKAENVKLSKTVNHLQLKLNEATEKIADLEKSKQEFENRYLKAEFDRDCLTKESAIANEKIEKLTEDYDTLYTSNEFLKKEFCKAEETRRKLHNEIQDLKGNIRVFCRLRPPVSEQEKFYQCNFNFPSEKAIEISKCRGSLAPGGLVKSLDAQEFIFDRVFGQEATQNDIFEELSHLIQSAIDGYHICVFAYGQTGSGKTYTMQGDTDPERIGMIPRSIKLIFDKKDEMENKGWSLDIKASFLEIYNESVRDLLDPTNGKPLEIRFNKGQGTTVSNLTIVSFTTAHELTSCMFKALENRATAGTIVNERSSRSHAVTKIYIEARYKDSNSLFVGSVSLVDLAGSESAKAVLNERLMETKNINKSLSSLGNVMLALHKKETHIPYRDSKLTFLLQSSLGGNCKCLMIVNISPYEENYGETINTLRFASKVKEVKTETSRNKLTSVNITPRH